jgi:flagellar hook protein FlgE
MEMTANLDSNEVVPTAAWDLLNPSDTSNFATSMTVYDSLGNARDLEVYFRKTGDNAWDYHVVTDGANVDGGTAGTNVELGTGSMTFTTDGALDTATAPALSVDFAGATPGQAIEMNFGTPIADGGTGLDGFTQFSAQSNISSQNQDGYASGEFSGLTVDGQGVVMGLYTNGEQLAIGQLSVAKFRSNDGLSRAGQSLWIETRDSGPAALGTAGSGGRGAVSAGALESANVDLAEEFVGLIQHQRAFSANSKTITTADEMLQELINIKR